ncbi:MAG: hypothetical protein EXR71_18765 [Myxococcales bacterium]|nr:hypothetical protein [Myxococcales bacterium]
MWWAHFESLDEEDADDPKRVRALERAGWHLAEATRLAEGCGDVQQAELLKGDALERALLASVHSPAGEQVWNRRARARIERTLARGDLQQALLDLDAGADVVEQFDADERDLEALLDGLAGLLARAVSEAEARGEPWWVGPYGDLETRLKSGAG